jgi:hypothetical protein
VGGHALALLGDFRKVMTSAIANATMNNTGSGKHTEHQGDEQRHSKQRVEHEQSRLAHDIRIRLRRYQGAVCNRYLFRCSRTQGQMTKPLLFAPTEQPREPQHSDYARHHRGSMGTNTSAGSTCSALATRASGPPHA